ncbi:hypothetical protein [Methylovorus glucosotrophus]|uniref:Uncharacterized protein n=1 Tax=Methylovorus glucosotrophus (strain SIP3-4) TaxID=582744 RepID=C6X7Z1_METGS|nr:hypothetical protein [Methylovorus glucosotrophus]ACT51318.1 hypothetical protein Msip34_2076 [Methylovorus glucosotrophus SIP3-4]
MTEKKGRYIAALEPIGKLQIAIWFDYLLEKSGCLNAKEFDSWVKSKNLDDELIDKLDSIEWSAYEKLARTPSERTLLAVENVIQGSIKRFQQGHDTLPLIAILNGSQVDCERHLLEVLGEFKLYKRNMTLRAKCEALFDLVIAKSLVIDHSKDIEDELAGLITGGYYSIEEIMAMPNNLVSESFDVGYKKLTTSRFENAKPFVYGQFKILHERVVVAVLSLIHICLKSDSPESKLIAYYLVDGVGLKALEVYFGKQVAEYVREEF